MVIFQGNPHSFCHSVQCVLCLMRQQHSCNAYRIHIGKFPGKPLPLRIFLDKAHIEICIMCYQYRPFTEGKKFRQNRFYHRCIHDHAVIDAGQFFNFKGNGHIRIYKSGKLFCDHALFNLNSPDLNDFVIDRGKSRCLNIKNHKIRRKVLSLFAGHDLLQIVHQIGLHPINDLKEILLIRVFVSRLDPLCLFCLPEILPDVICIREGLHDSMICNGNSRMAPFIGPLYNILRFRYPVHIAHLGMAVQLHSFMGAVIASGGCKIRDLLYSCKGADSQLVVKLINGGHTLQLYKGSHLDPFLKLSHLIIVGKQLYGHGICKIRHIKHEDGSLVFDLPGIKANDLPADDNFSHFS